MDQQKTMIRMIQDLYRNSQGGQRMSTTSRHTAYFPLVDKQDLEALEGDLASQRDLRQELVSCFWFPLFPIHRTMCGTAPQNQHWAPNWFRFFFLRYLNINIVPFIHHLIALFLPDILVHTRKTMRLIWNTAVRTRPSGLLVSLPPPRQDSASFIVWLLRRGAVWAWIPRAEKGSHSASLTTHCFLSVGNM